MFFILVYCCTLFCLCVFEFDFEFVFEFDFVSGYCYYITFVLPSIKIVCSTFHSLSCSFVQFKTTFSYSTTEQGEIFQKLAEKTFYFFVTNFVFQVTCN